MGKQGSYTGFPIGGKFDPFVGLCVAFFLHYNRRRFQLIVPKKQGRNVTQCVQDVELANVLRDARGTCLVTLKVGFWWSLCNRTEQGVVCNIGKALNVTRVRAMAAIVEFNFW